MLNQQKTGVNTVAFLGTIILENSLIGKHSRDEKSRDEKTRDEKKSAEVAVVIVLAFGAANYLGGLPAYWLSDKVGRSMKLAIGPPNTAWSTSVYAFLFQDPRVVGPGAMLSSSPSSLC
jgi:hypothetical protein